MYFKLYKLINLFLPQLREREARTLFVGLEAVFQGDEVLYLRMFSVDVGDTISMLSCSKKMARNSSKLSRPSPMISWSRSMFLVYYDDNSLPFCQKASLMLSGVIKSELSVSKCLKRAQSFSFVRTDRIETVAAKNSEQFILPLPQQSTLTMIDLILCDGIF